MQTKLRDIANRLSDDELLRRVRVLAACEREATVELVAHLTELDIRKLHLGQGFGSLFSYCTEVLHLAEHAAYNRIEAARASRKFPVILDRLADGSLNLSSVRLLAPHLTPENHERVLQQAAGKSKRDVELLVARLAPCPDVPASVRRLPPSMLLAGPPAISTSDTTAATHAGAASAPPAAPNSEAAASEPVAPASDPVDGAAGSTAGDACTCGAPVEPAARRLPVPDPAAALSPAISQSRPLIAPLSPERYRVQFTVGRETHENLRRAQDLLRREIPDGDPGMIFDRALKLLLEDVARKKLAATSRPRPGRATAAGSRHIPAPVKRAVWLRDGGQCAFVANSGRRCRERAFLEFHHVDPYAVGGEATIAGISLRCRAHNVHEAERVGLVAPVAGASVPGRRRRRWERLGHSPRGELSGSLG